MHQTGPLRSVIAPPFPHDPRDRCWIHETRGWHIRMLALNDPRRQACIAHGLQHLQLWHPELSVSILTPSKMTDDSFEVWNNGNRARLCGYKHLSQYIGLKLKTAVPCYGVIQQFERFYVHATYLGAPSPAAHHSDSAAVH